MGWPSEDQIVQQALGYPRSFSLQQLRVDSGGRYEQIDRILSRLVASGDINRYRTPEGQTRYEWL